MMRGLRLLFVSRVDGYVRYMVQSYLIHIQLVLVMLACIVIAIDISPWVGRVWVRADGGIGASLSDLAHFFAYRAVDDCIQVFPIACILGMLWVEVLQARSGHGVMMQVTGRTALRRLSPLFVLAVAIFGIQFVLDNYVRPAAVMALISEKIGSYRSYSDWPARRERVWLAVDGGILEARFSESDGGPRLVDPVYFHFKADRLSGITSAREAMPEPSVPGGWNWTFASGHELYMSDSGQVDSLTPYARYPGQAFESRTMPLAIDPMWFSYRGIQPKYLPPAVLGHLAASENVPRGQPNYKAWNRLRAVQAFNTAFLSLLVVLVFRQALVRHPLPVAAAASLIVGYVGFVAMRLVSVLAEHGVFPPVMDALLLPALLFVLSVWCAWLHTRFDRLVPSRLGYPRANSRTVSGRTDVAALVARIRSRIWFMNG